mmetsp:Transcript_34553/g.58531  ORF Transcript_34553/g.58531 Transcript_34553/m.58531 type:complete len:96 (+) Transcript_34553:962-1249(+)
MVSLGRNQDQQLPLSLPEVFCLFRFFSAGGEDTLFSLLHAKKKNGSSKRVVSGSADDDHIGSHRPITSISFSSVTCVVRAPGSTLSKGGIGSIVG